MTARGRWSGVAAMIPELDAWRRDGRARDPGKEWHHFVVFDPAWTLLFNLNLDGAAGGRAIAVVHHEGWRAEVRRCIAPNLRRGRLDATFDDAGMRWRDGRYEVWFRGEDVSLEAALEPASMPSLSHDISLGSDARLSWCLVPRLFATGSFAYGGRRVSFDARPAYHDHNWGRFVWGGDFAWDWGCAVSEAPGSPWTVIFARMMDRAQRRTTATSVFLMRDGRCLRYFRDAEVHFAQGSERAPAPCARVPAAAALLLPDEDRDVPSRVTVNAGRGDDALRISLELAARGQLLVPSERALESVVRVNEAHGRVRVDGRCDGAEVAFEGPALLEVVRG